MLAKIEQEYLNRLNPYPPNGYNMSYNTISFMRDRFGNRHPNYGRHWSEIVRKNMSKGMKGRIPWNKGKKGVQVSKIKGKHLILTKKEHRNLSESHKGCIPWNKGTKGIMIAWNKGKKGVQVAWNKGKKTGQIPWNKGKKLSTSLPFANK